MNTWAGKGAPPAGPTSAGMREFTIELPGEGDLAEVVTRLDRGGVALTDAPEGGVRFSVASGNTALLTTRKFQGGQL